MANIEAKIRELTAEVEYQKSEVEFHKKAFVEKNNDYHNACDKIGEINKMLTEERTKRKAAEMEIIKLKAKLYDMMTADNA